MASSERQSVHVELPLETHQALKDADQKMWEIIDQAVKIHLAVETDTLAALHRQKEKYETQIEQHDDDIKELESSRSELIDCKKRIEEQIEELRQEYDDYEEIIRKVVSALEESKSLKIESQRKHLETAAEIQNNGVITEDAIDEVCSDVRDYVRNSTSNIAEHRLVRGTNANVAENYSDQQGPELRSIHGGDNDSE